LDNISKIYIVLQLMFYNMNHTFVIVIITFALVLSVLVSNPSSAQLSKLPTSQSNAQSLLPPHSSAATPKLHAVKVISPTKSQQVPIGKDLTISGTSMYDPTSTSDNCQVVVGVNQVKPYQPATATGTGGTKDYSKWNFILTSKYTTIKQGPNNKITAKYTCTNNPSVVSYSSVNVTGISLAKTAAAPQSPLFPTAAASPTQQLQKQQPVAEISNSTTESNATIIQQSAAQVAPSTLGSNKLVYIGSSQTFSDSGSVAHHTGGESSGNSHHKSSVSHSSSSSSSSSHGNQQQHHDNGSKSKGHPSSSQHRSHGSFIDRILNSL
jgi:hypothetical protein